MSKETCTIPPCPHGKGFNCPTCWPKRHGVCHTHGSIQVYVGWDFCDYCGKPLVGNREVRS